MTTTVRVPCVPCLASHEIPAGSVLLGPDLVHFTCPAGHVESWPVLDAPMRAVLLSVGVALLPQTLNRHPNP